MRPLVSILTMFVLATGVAVPAAAAPCKDARGKFTKCPTAAVAGMRCKTAAGKFAKCGTPGAIPIKK